MRKTLLMLIAVAILGILSVYAYHQPDNTPVSSAAGYISGKRDYRSGTFIGNTIDTPYGELQVEAVVQNGQLSDITALKLPNDKTQAREINAKALPQLKASALKVQSADIDFVSGATMTSFSYQHSLQAALDRAAVQ